MGGIVGAAGLVDDLAGDRAGHGGTRGLTGHLAALGRGRPTTGALKVAAGVVGGLAAAATLGGDAVPAGGIGRWRDGGVVALSANLGNLLDRAPGRTTKAAAAAAAGLLGADRLAPGPALLVAATLATLPADLAQTSMLGDTGANLSGAAVGVGLVSGLSPRGRWVALAALGALTLASERWSFSAVIDSTPPLRWLDGLGQCRSDG